MRPFDALEPSGSTVEAWLRVVGASLGDFIDSLATEDARPAALRIVPSADIPRVGRPFDVVVRELFDTAIAPGYRTAGPGYLAYIPGGGLPLSAVAALIADVTNRYTGLAMAAPALVALECAVIRWLCQVVGLPDASFGILTTGGSMATFTAMVAARVDRLPEDFLDAVIYTSTDSHHSVAKAARLAGFPKRAMRILPVDSYRRLRIDALETAIAEDLAAGRRPFMVVAAAGTTNTGAVDPIPGIADVCETFGLWLHVDGAYGGAFMVTERGRARLAGISRADSVTLDPHKGFFLPYGTGALLVRDRRTLAAAHEEDAPYLPASADDSVNFASLSGELSRDFRGLRLWLPLQVAGAHAFTAALDEKLTLAEHAARDVATVPGVILVAPIELSLFAFRLAAPEFDQEARCALNRRFLDAINARGHIYLSGTLIDDEFVLRLCVLSFRTHGDRIAAGLADIRAAAAELAAVIETHTANTPDADPTVREPA